MAFNMDKVPTSKPNNSSASIDDGRYHAVVYKAEMKTSKKGEEYLAVTFKTDGGSFVNEGFFDNPEKQFLMYKIGRLLTACKAPLEGEVGLADIIKVIRNKRVIIDVATNDAGYANLDFSDDKEGVYAPDELVMDTVPADAPSPATTASPVALDDDDDF